MSGQLPEVTRRGWRILKGRSIREDPYGNALTHPPSFLLRPLFERLIAKRSIPEDQQRLLAELASQGNIVYAVKYRSQLDFVYLNILLHRMGLPYPCFAFDLCPYFWHQCLYGMKLTLYHLWEFIRVGQRPDPYGGGYYREQLIKGRSGLLFLVGEQGYYQRAVLVQNEPIEHMLMIQRELSRPIFIVPVVLLRSRHPGKESHKPFEVTRHLQDGGTFGKFLQFIRGYADSVIEIGEPLNLQQVLPELAPRKSQRRNQIFQLRRELIESIDRIRRAIVGPQVKSKLELKEIILNHPKLEAYIQRRARARGIEAWRIRKEADRYLDEIAADYNYTLIRVGKRLLTWMWSNLFDGIDINIESLQKVKRAARHSTLVYIPCHKSHIDYLILSYVLLHNNLYSPFIAAGRNLAFWPLGPIFRRLGAFFIRRSFQGKRLYAEVLALYIKTMVQLGHNIEFFIEGGRSRTGKMVLPKLGLLTILIQAVEEGFCDDLVFVPTSICYDRIPEEEAYLKEVTGDSKVQESLSQLVRARRFLKRRYGRVYVQFAEPISLKRYLERKNYDLKTLTPKQRHAVYRDFAYLIISSINKVSLVTPHALVAASLLSTPKRGICLPELQQISWDFKAFLDGIKVRFSRTFSHYELAIQDTLRNLERSRLIERLKDDDDELEEQVFTIDDSKRITLEYYKNNIIHFLLPACFVCTSVLAQKTFRVSPSQILEDIEFMKDFFKFEFVYDSDTGSEQMMQRVLDVFEDQGWFHRIGEEKNASYLITHKGLSVAQWFHGLLRNYFEGYWLVLRAIKYLEKKPYTEKDFLKKTLATGQKMLKLGLIDHPEANSKIIFANALKYYLEKKVIVKTVKRDKGRDKVQEVYSPGERQLAQYYSRAISRFLRSPRFVLQQ